jgi:hypothetical protein
MPDLYSYFEALDISTDIFLFEWLMTLYAKNMDLRIVSRIWDHFMLDGEIFAIRVGLGILTYFRSNFLRGTHYDIV